MRYLLFGYLLFCTTVYSQNKLEGTVYRYNASGSNEPLEGVMITAPGGGSVVTKKNGHYALNFDSTVSVVSIRVVKKGYEVINEEELKSIDLLKKRWQDIYLDLEGNTRKRERELLDVAIAQRLKLRNSYSAILEKGGEEADSLKLRLEKEAGESFRDLDELKRYVYKKYDTDSRVLESIAPSIIRLNLDHSNKEVEKMKELVLKGMVDSVRMLFDLKQRYVQVKNRMNNLDSLQAGIENEKQIIKASIPGLLLEERFTRVDSCYRLMILMDTTDLNTYFDYAQFLQSQNNFNEAMHYYVLVLEKRRLLAIQEPKLHEPDMAKTLNSLGNLLRDMEDYPAARRHYEVALEMYRRLAVKDAGTYEPRTVEILESLNKLK